MGCLYPTLSGHLIGMDESPQLNQERTLLTHPLLIGAFTEFVEDLPAGEQRDCAPVPAQGARHLVAAACAIARSAATVSWSLSSKSGSALVFTITTSRTGST